MLAGVLGALRMQGRPPEAIAQLKVAEIWGDMGRYGEMRGDMGRYREIWGDMGRYGEI